MRPKKFLRLIKRSANKIFGTKVDELFWKFRNIFDRKWPENYISRESINHPHRKFLIDKISVYYPFENILEIGCASGPNLYLLAKKFPEIKLYGIDISKKAIEVGKKAIVLCEQHSDSEPSFYKDRWIHNYKFIFKEFVAQERVKMDKISPEMWPGHWAKFGYIIEILSILTLS